MNPFTLTYYITGLEVGLELNRTQQTAHALPRRRSFLNVPPNCGSFLALVIVGRALTRFTNFLEITGVRPIMSTKTAEQISKQFFAIEVLREMMCGKFFLIRGKISKIREIPGCEIYIPVYCVRVYICPVSMFVIHAFNRSLARPTTNQQTPRSASAPGL